LFEITTSSFLPIYSSLSLGQWGSISVVSFDYFTGSASSLPAGDTVAYQLVGRGKLAKALIE